MMGPAKKIKNESLSLPFMDIAGVEPGAQRENRFSSMEHLIVFQL